MSSLNNPHQQFNRAEFKDPTQADLIRFSDDRPIRYFGYLIVLFVFVFLGGWAYWAPLGSAAQAPGTMTVEGYRKTVQHLEGGIVKAIHVRDGDTVKKDQTLIELEDTSSKAQLQTLRGQFFSALAREARLIAERDAKTAIYYPESLQNERQDSRAEEAIHIQNQSFIVRKRSRNGEIEILKEQQQQLAAKIEGIKSQKNNRNNLANSLSTELVDMHAMLEKGYVERPRVSELERRLSEAQGDYGNLVAEISTSQTQISEIALKILQIEKEFQREVMDELGKVQPELSELREKIEWLNDTMSRTVIKAPEAGMVLGLTVHTLGAVVPPGGHLLDIVPQKEKLIVEAQVSLNDIDRVHIGQSTEIRFSTFKSAKTPKVSGRVMTISADRLTDEKTQMSYYLARIEVDKVGLDDLGKRGLFLLPGMPAEVLINTGDRTFFEYLAQPLSNIFARSFIED